MSIETRVRKIEAEMKTREDFCACGGDPKYPRTETIYFENGEPAISPDLINQTLPDTCPTCGKAIHKIAIIVDFVDAGILQPKEAR